MDVSPKAIQRSLKILRHLGRRKPHLDPRRYCPVCRMPSEQFIEFGIVHKRSDAKCTRCGALERHRLLWLYFERMTNLLDRRPKRMLHIAPEAPIEGLLKRRLGSGYLTADLHDSRVNVRMDITNIQYAEETFDVVCCCHVLEHIPEDRRAIREIYRVLKPNGWAAVLVPTKGLKTVEDSTIVEPSERRRLFGQEGHVRRYGADFLERLEEAKFAVKVIAASDFLEKEEIKHMGINPEQKVYHCTK